MFQTNLRETDVLLDVDEVLDEIEAFGADTWLISVGGIYAWYPTSLPFQTVNPYLDQRPGGDLVGDALSRAHERGIRVMARMDFSKVAAAVAAENPDWCFRSHDGRRQEYNGLVSVCPSGPYYQERTFEILDEVLDRYDVDGFFFNWFGFNEIDYSGTRWGVCHCASCRRTLGVSAQATAATPADGRAAAGPHRQEPPALPVRSGDPGYRQWREGARTTVATLAAKMRGHIAARRPDAGLILGESADIHFHEANNAVGRDFWPAATSDAVSGARTHRPDRPVLVNSVAFIDIPYRMASEEPEHFAQYLIQTLARGANPSTYIMGVPGDIPYPCLEVAGEITRFHRRWSAVYDGLRPAAPTVLVKPDSGVDGGEDEYRGVHAALQQHHVPFDVLAAAHLTDLASGRGLDDVRLIILPEVGAVPPEAVAVIDEFVRAGGAVLSTGGGPLDGDTVQLASLPARSRRATDSRPEHLLGSYVAAEPVPKPLGYVYPSPVLPVHGAYHYFDWHLDAQWRLARLGAAMFGPPEKCHGYAPVDHPGVVSRSYGSGRTAMIPWAVGRTYHDLALAPVSELIAEIATDLLGPGRAVSAALPEQVELTMQAGSAGTVVHLRNLSGARRRGFGPPLPIGGGTLRWHGSQPHQVISLTTGERCDVVARGGAWEVTVPAFGRFEVLVVSSAEEAARWRPGP